MCRNIKTLYNFEPPATEEEIYLSSLQFVRKLSGFTRPSKANQAAFDRAVDKVSRGGARADRFARDHRPAARPRGRGLEGQGATAERSRVFPLRHLAIDAARRTHALRPCRASLSTCESCSRALVAFDTTSAKSNLALIAFVEDYLKGHGIASTRVPSPDGAKADLFATIGAEGHGGIGLSGHSDCVPVEGQRWTTDPFTLTERDGKLYGRGSLRHEGLSSPACSPRCRCSSRAS